MKLVDGYCLTGPRDVSFNTADWRIRWDEREKECIRTVSMYIELTYRVVLLYGESKKMVGLKQAGCWSRVVSIYIVR